VINNSTTYSVSELTQLIKQSLENQFPSVWVSGEISNFIHHRSGHMYFTLKDQKSEIKAVIFKGNNLYLPFRPENGMQVLLQGRLAVYEQRGYYQIIGTRMEPAGTGTLYLAFEALKKKLSAEGLFADEIKQQMPPYPRKIGIITSPTGAAIRDITQILQRRAPYVQLILRPAIVQGTAAASDIADAVQDFSAYSDVDLIIVGRGGGSLEDLWPFNEELVARAVADCKIPVIAAVGHETDTTIIDLVADLRASTPSAAAELAAPALTEIAGNLDYYQERIIRSMDRSVERYQQNLDHLTARYGFRQPRQLLDHWQERFERLERELVRTPLLKLQLWQEQVNTYSQRLTALNPGAILIRGYALATRKSDNRIIRNPDDLAIDEEFSLQLAAGAISARKTVGAEAKK